MILNHKKLYFNAIRPSKKNKAKIIVFLGTLHYCKPNAWDDNDFVLAVIERLGIEENGGIVRIGPEHYNTLDEIEHLGQVWRTIVN